MLLRCRMRMTIKPPAALARYEERRLISQAPFYFHWALLFKIPKKKGKLLASPFVKPPCANRSVYVDSDLSRLRLVGFGNVDLEYSVAVGRLYGILLDGLREEKRAGKFPR